MNERVALFAGCIVAYVLAFASRRTHRVPVLLCAGALVAGVLVMLGDSHRDAFRSAIKPFSYVLGPMTVSLAIPLERARATGRFSMSRATWLLLASAIASVAVITILARSLHAPQEIVDSLAPRAATNALSVPTAEALGGSGSVASVIVALSGVVVALAGPWVLSACGVVDPSARGLALGSAGHLVATARAYEESEDAGAASSFALAMHGFLTVLACFAFRLFGAL